MKLFIALLLLLVAVANAAFPRRTRGTIISRKAATEIQCQPNDYGFKCNSCYSAVACNGGENVGKITCPLSEKYCDPQLNSCTDKRPTGCNVDFAFTCTSEGFFPHPTNCQVYFFCLAPNADADVWECPANYVYDTLTGYCVEMVSDADCVIIECTRQNTFITHPTNPNFYAFCNANLQPILFQCPKNKQFVNPECKYVCTSAGFYLGSTNNEAYVCTTSGTEYVRTILNFADGFAPNETFSCNRASSP